MLNAENEEPLISISAQTLLLLAVFPWLNSRNPPMNIFTIFFESFTKCFSQFWFLIFNYKSIDKYPKYKSIDEDQIVKKDYY